MKKFPSHITLGHHHKNSNLQKPQKCLTPISTNKPFYYKSPNLASGIAQKKELFLKDSKKTIGSPRAIQISNNKSAKKSFRRKTENIVEYKQHKNSFVSDQLKERLQNLQGRLAEIKHGYEIRKQKNEINMSKQKRKQQKNGKQQSIIKDSYIIKKNSSKKKITLVDKGQKQNQKYTVSSSRLNVQSPKRLILSDDKKNSFKRDDKRKYTLTKNPLQDYITQYQVPQSFKVSQVASEINLIKPHSVKNSNSIGISLRQTLANEKVKMLEKQYYISSIITAINTKMPTTFDQLCSQHINASFEFLNYIKRQKIKIPPKPATFHQLSRSSPLKKHTIIFDLDQTLIHCHDGKKSTDARLPVAFPDGSVINVSINLRPYARECLREISKDFEIIVFTASHECYAKVVVEYLDPQGKYISHHLSREDCYKTEVGFYVKDLRVIDRDLSNILLVDNAAYSYCFQPQNGIPIVPFYDNKADLELKSLVSYLKKFVNETDVRGLNNKIMKLTEYTKFRNPQDLVQTLYNTYNSIF